MTPIPARAVNLSRAPLTEVGLGCSQLGNLYRAVTDEEATATVDRAWELGVRYFDTAPHYGLGLSERRLGAALAQRKRDDYVVSTKVGRRLEPLDPPFGRDDEGFDVAATHRRVWDFSRDGVLRSLDQSLERLALDRVDVVFVHDPDNHWSDALAEAYPALEELRAQGVVASIGAGMNQTAMLADFVRHTATDVVMLAGRYTLLEQDALDELLPLCVERGVAVVAAGVFNSGVLARDDPRAGVKHDYREASGEVINRARRIAGVCKRHGVSLPAAAIAFPLAHPAIVSVCLGARSPAQIAHDVELYSGPIAPDVWEELKSEGLLRADAPTPA
jgi:D-threo-aldose 1-dehydrogenase